MTQTQWVYGRRRMRMTDLLQVVHRNNVTDPVPRPPPPPPGFRYAGASLSRFSGLLRRAAACRAEADSRTRAGGLFASAVHSARSHRRRAARRRQVDSYRVAGSPPHAHSGWRGALELVVAPEIQAFADDPMLNRRGFAARDLARFRFLGAVSRFALRV